MRTRCWRHWRSEPAEDYSARRASDGAIQAARRAGSQAASPATTTSTAATPRVGPAEQDHPDVPGNQADTGHGERLQENRSDHSARLCTESHPHADLSSTVSDRVRDHAIDTRPGQQEPDAREQRQQHREEALLRE